MAIKVTYTNRLISFHYDAKYRNDPYVLPVWDAVPLVYVISIKGRWFDGINLHHLPMKNRIAFVEVMTKLSQQVKNPKRFANLTYRLVKKDKRFRGVIKGYRLYLRNRAYNALYIKKEDLPKLVRIQPKYIARKYDNRKKLEALKKKKTQEKQKKKASETRTKRIKKRDDKKKSKKR